MLPLSRRASGWVCCLVIVAAVGCGSGGSVPLYPVSGEVKVAGQPLANGNVTLQPDRSKGNASQEVPVGQIKEGRYEIFTGRRRGAPLGVYKVLVVSDNFSGRDVPPKGATAEMPKSVIDAKYGDPARTPLVVEVVTKPVDGAYDLKVTR